jgi:hypothetical protein
MNQDTKTVSVDPLGRPHSVREFKTFSTKDGDETVLVVNGAPLNQFACLVADLSAMASAEDNQGWPTPRKWRWIVIEVQNGELVRLAGDQLHLFLPQDEEEVEDFSATV